LGWAWVSTGAFYRGLALAAQKEGIDLWDENAIAELAQNRLIWHVEMHPDNSEVIYRGQVVTAEIKTEQLGSIASKISNSAKVRQALLQPQRNCSHFVKGLVAEGRDCGTVVFPQAQAKFYLTADGSHRAKRRAREDGLSRDEILARQVERDQRDSERTIAPLAPAPDAQVIDSTELDFHEVVDLIVREIRKRLPKDFL
jgi:cytidylate kinase